MQGKRAVVTGAGRGIGLAIVERLAAEGARVAALDMDGDLARAAGSSPRSAGHLGIACDVADSSQVDAAFSRVKDAFGGIDILVNNAATGRGPNDGSDEMWARQNARAEQFARGDVPDIHPDQLIFMSDEGWAHVIGVNLTGAFYCSRAAVRLMAEAGHGGAIVNIASTSQRSGEGPLHYVASKGGIVGLTRGLARELASRNIRVNAVNPGPTDTPVMRGIPASFADSLKQTVLLGRFGQPEEIAAAVAFLASDDRSFATGGVLTVSGGAYMV